MIMKDMPLDEAFGGGGIRTFGSDGVAACGGILRGCGFDVCEQEGPAPAHTGPGSLVMRTPSSAPTLGGS